MYVNNHETVERCYEEETGAKGREFRRAPSLSEASPAPGSPTRNKIQFNEQELVFNHPKHPSFTLNRSDNLHVHKN